MFEIHIILIFLLILSFIDWRKGLFICILVGFFQDPIRKLMPGHSVYYTVLIVPFILSVLLGLIQYQKGMRINLIFNLYPKIKLTLIIFLLIVAAQSMRTLIVTNDFNRMGIGLVSYIGPLAGVLLAFNYALEKRNVTNFLIFYLIIGFLFVTGVLAEASGYQSPVLGSVGGNHLFIYFPYRLVLQSGLMRAAEISAWHATMVAMLSVVIFALSSPSWRKYIWLGIAGIALCAIVFTGRRKGFYVFGGFIIIATILAFYSYAKSWKKYIGFVLLGCISILILFQLITLGDSALDFNAYTYRLVHEYANETPFDRFMQMTINSFQWVILHNGILGSGAGTGSQGVQHFGGALTGLSAEGGVSKVLAELGVPGLVLALLLFFILIRYIWNIIIYVNRQAIYEPLTIGLSSILIAEAMHFSMANQAFGDPFIMLLMGFFAGFTLAIPLISKEKNIQQWKHYNAPVLPVLRPTH